MSLIRPELLELQDLLVDHILEHVENNFVDRRREVLLPTQRMIQAKSLAKTGHKEMTFSAWVGSEQQAQGSVGRFGGVAVGVGRWVV